MSQRQSASSNTSILVTFIISHVEMHHLFTEKTKERNEMRGKQSLALNNEMRKNEMKTKPCI